jgi:hypothetical protein
LVGCCVVVRRPISSSHAIMRPSTLSLLAAFADKTTISNSGSTGGRLSIRSSPSSPPPAISINSSTSFTGPSSSEIYHQRPRR